MTYQLGYDWLVHYRPDDDPATEDTAILSLFDIVTAELALHTAISVLGPREIVGVMRRDLIANADEIIGSGKPN